MNYVINEFCVDVFDFSHSCLLFHFFHWTCSWFSASSHHVLRMRMFHGNDGPFSEHFGTEYHIYWMRIMMMTKLVVEQIDLWTNSIVLWHSTGGDNPSHIPVIFHCWMFYFSTFHFCWCELLDTVSKIHSHCMIQYPKLFSLI